MKYIYAIAKHTENGYSPDETEYVTSSRALNSAEQLILKNCLTEARKNTPPDTYNNIIIRDAISRFHEATGRNIVKAHV